MGLLLSGKELGLLSLKLNRNDGYERELQYCLVVPIKN